MLSSRFCPFHFGKLVFQSCSIVTPGQVSSVGVPRTLHEQLAWDTISHTWRSWKVDQSHCRLGRTVSCCTFQRKCIPLTTCPLPCSTAALPGVLQEHDTKEWRPKRHAWEKKSNDMPRNLVCVHSDRDSDCPCETKVCELYGTFVVNKKILRLKITMQDSALMAEAKCLTYLKKFYFMLSNWNTYLEKVAFDNSTVQHLTARQLIQVFFEIHWQEFKN